MDISSFIHFYEWKNNYKNDELDAYEDITAEKFPTSLTVCTHRSTFSSHFCINEKTYHHFLPEIPVPGFMREQNIFKDAVERRYHRNNIALSYRY